MRKLRRTKALILSAVIIGASTCIAVAFDKVGANIEHGKKIYDETCVACHGANGKGEVPGAPDFTKKHGRLAEPDQTLFDHVKDGFRSSGSPMAMPSKGGNPDLSDQDIKDVLGYMHHDFAPR